MKIQLYKDIQLLTQRKEMYELKIKIYEKTLKEMKENLEMIEKRIKITKQLIGEDVNDRPNNI